jgi:Flp pilus assembly protein TadG
MRTLIGQKRIPCRRRGSALVEGIVVLSALLLVAFGAIVGGLGVARYQKLAAVAREASRWAAVRGASYQRETGNAAATPADVYNNVIQPQAGLLHLSDLSYTVTWDNPSKAPVYFDAASRTWKRNQVQVALTYQWHAEMFLGTHTLASTSKMPISY